MVAVVVTTGSMAAPAIAARHWAASTPSGTRASATRAPDAVSRLPAGCQVAPSSARTSQRWPATSTRAVAPLPVVVAAPLRVRTGAEPVTRSPVTRPPAVTAGTNGVMTALGAAAGGAALTWIPLASARTASGCAQIGWLSGPVSAEVHHWFVGSAPPASPVPACTGALVGPAPAGGAGAKLPLPPGWGGLIAVSAALSVTVPTGAARVPAGVPAVQAAASSNGTGSAATAIRRNRAVRRRRPRPAGSEGAQRLSRTVGHRTVDKAHDPRAPAGPLMRPG